MQVYLQSERIDFSRSSKIALVDAAIWVWFYQTSHAEGSILTMATEASWYGQGALGIIIAALVLLLKWDAFPQRFRILAPIVASSACALLTAVGLLDLSGTVVQHATLAVLSFSACACQLLRLDNLAKSDNIRMLATVLTESLVMFYALNLILAESSQILRDIFMIVAPCALLAGLKTPSAPTKNMRPFSLKTLVTTPNVLVCAFGIAGGFVFVAGALHVPTGLNDLFHSPMPTYPTMQLLYMALAITASSGLRLPKAMYFSLVNLSWAFGSLLGSFAMRMAPQIPEAVSFVLAAAVMMSFFLFQSTWIDRPETMPSTPDQLVEEIAGQYGLTKRETEVAALLLEGRSLRHIQNALFISEGTAKTHAKHIYAKLNVRTKQELIDLFKNGSR